MLCVKCKAAVVRSDRIAFCRYEQPPLILLFNVCDSDVFKALNRICAENRVKDIFHFLVAANFFFRVRRVTLEKGFHVRRTEVVARGQRVNKEIGGIGAGKVWRILEAVDSFQKGISVTVDRAHFP